MVKVIIKTATQKGKKLQAIFYENNKKIKTTAFGAKGYLDYTSGATKEQRERYIKRHTNSKENHNNPMTAGSLSFYILWGNSTSKAINIKAFKKKFNLNK